MGTLSQRDRSRIRYHLGYPEEKDDPGWFAKLGDRTGLENKMERMVDVTIINYVRERLERCDRALLRSELIPEDIIVGRDDITTEDILLAQSNVSGKQVVAGDINRSTTQINQPSDAARHKAYMIETNGLARDLQVRSYRANPLGGGLG